MDAWWQRGLCGLPVGDSGGARQAPQTVGEFALALAITAPVVIGAGLSLRGVQATDAASEYHFGNYLLLRLLTTGAAGLVNCGDCLAFRLRPGTPRRLF